MASTVMLSPSSIRPMVPPTAASGATWPTTNPKEPPEKRPSVIKATESSRPCPTIAAVGLSISRIPGPPTGPSLRTTITSPGLICLSRIAARQDSSLSKTRAAPVITGFLTPLILATAPSSARFPLRIARCPFGYKGLLSGRITSWPEGGWEGTAANTSARVLPSMVRLSPCRRPASSSSFITWGIPPAW